MLYIGIDPGKKGAIVSIGDDGIIVLHDMPDSTDELATFLGGFSLDCYIMCEDQHARPSSISKKVLDEKGKPLTVKGKEVKTTVPIRGAVAEWTFAQHFGEIRGILAALHIPREYISPHDWMRLLGIPPRPKKSTQPQWKKILKEKALELFPKVKVTLNNCDALLIAEVCRRIHQKRPTFTKNWADDL